MNTEACICDVCKYRVANLRCQFCSIDLCSACITQRLVIKVNSKVFGNLPLCESCSKALNKEKRSAGDIYTDEFKLQIVEQVRDHLKGRLFAARL